MNFIDSRLIKFLFFSCLIFAFFDCTKISNTDIGAGLIPPVDGVKTKDTVLDVITKNQAFDTVAVGFSDDHVLGYISNDPVFGTTSASINFQVALPNTNFGFGADQSTLVFDSVILSLSYKGVWGDSISPLAVHVYEMDPENLFTVDSAYNNTISFEKGNELTENNTAEIVSPNKLNDPDTLTQFSEDATNQLRIHLSSTFGNKLLHSYDSLNAYQNDSTFHNYIKGFIVEAEKQGNGLVRLNLSDTSTRLSLYYHISGVDSSGKVKRFATNALTCASSNTIIRNYSGAQLQNFYPPIANPNSQDSLLFIQTGPGTYAKIKIPGLDSLPNMIIHRAELLMQEVPDANDPTFSTPNLFIAAYSADSNRRFAVPYDLQFSGGTFVNLTTFGVAPIPKSVGTGTISTYSFDLSRYVQGIVTRHDSSYDLILSAPYNAYIHPVLETPYVYPISTPALNTVAIGRVRLGGGSSQAGYKMRLHIVYSPVQ